MARARQPGRRRESMRKGRVVGLVGAGAPSVFGLETEDDDSISYTVS